MKNLKFLKGAEDFKKDKGDVFEVKGISRIENIKGKILHEKIYCLVEGN